MTNAAPAQRRLCAVADIPEREGRSVIIDGTDIAVFRCPEAIRAVDNVCPHAGGPLADGVVAGDTVTCPLHGRNVDLRTGVVTDCEDTVRVHDVLVSDGIVFLADGGR